MDLRTWIVDDHASWRSRLGSSVLELVPRGRWLERTTDASSSVTALLFHVARHEDVAINAVVRATDPVLDSWAERLSPALPPGIGLAEAEDRAVSERLDPEAVVGYLAAVHASTAAFLADVDLATLDDVPDSLAGLTRAGVKVDDYPWLARLWDGKPVAFHVSWEAIGHPLNHVGELVALRNALGLSPF